MTYSQQSTCAKLENKPLCAKLESMAVMQNSVDQLYNIFGLLLLLFTRPLPRDGGMAEDHGAPEAGPLPRVWTRGHKETKSRQRVSGAKSP